MEEGAIFDACYHQYCDDFGNVDFDMLTELSQAAVHATMTLVAHPHFAEVDDVQAGDVSGEQEHVPEEIPYKVDHACHAARRLIR